MGAPIFGIIGFLLKSYLIILFGDLFHPLISPYLTPTLLSSKDGSSLFVSDEMKEKKLEEEEEDEMKLTKVKKGGDARNHLQNFFSKRKIPDQKMANLF